MHLHCQQRMLESSFSYGRTGPLLRCGVCHAMYSNADARPVWRLSLTGALWCTCPAGVLVMIWSASTVLDKGAVDDPVLSYNKLSWWQYQTEHPTWWRLIGLAYLAIAAFMCLVALGWLAFDLVGRSATRALGIALPEPLCVRRRVVVCWKPEEGVDASHVWAAAALPLAWRQWTALLLPCDVTGSSHDDDNDGVTVLL